jgi:FkbM family methyltransferase
MHAPPSPLRLPESLKKLARAARDNRTINNVVTALARPIVRALPPRGKLAVKGHMPRVGLATADLPNGQKLKLYSDVFECIVTEVFYGDWTGDEPETLPLWSEYAAKSEIIIDVGAHIGHLSIVAGLINTKAKIFSFEPLPRVADLLRRNVQLNNLQVDVRQKALGREPGTAPFFAIPGGIPSSSSLSKEFMLQSGVKEIEAVSVEVSTLDAENIPEGVTLLKLDTETTEPDVVAGAHKLLKRKPVIFVEVIDDGKRLTSELSSAGYEFDAYHLSDRGAVLTQGILPFDGRWPNFLLLPKKDQ